MIRIIRFVAYSLAVMFVVALVGGIAFRSLVRRAEQNPNYAISESVGIAFVRLLEENKLPGIFADELEGPIRESGFDIVEKTVLFPVERRIRVRKIGEADAEYYYAMSKADEQSPWVLVRAWKERGGQSTNIWSNAED